MRAPVMRVHAGVDHHEAAPLLHAPHRQQRVAARIEHVRHVEQVVLDPARGADLPAHARRGAHATSRHAARCASTSRATACARARSWWRQWPHWSTRAYGTASPRARPRRWPRALLDDGAPPFAEQGEVEAGLATHHADADEMLRQQAAVAFEQEMLDRMQLGARQAGVGVRPAQAQVDGVDDVARLSHLSAAQLDAGRLQQAMVQFADGIARPAQCLEVDHGDCSVERPGALTPAARSRPGGGSCRRGPAASPRRGGRARPNRSRRNRARSAP